MGSCGWGAGRLWRRCCATWPGSCRRRCRSCPRGPAGSPGRKDLLFLVVEHPPQCRTLRVSRGKKGGDDYQPYLLALPYVIYVLTFYRDGFEEMKMFFRNSSLSSLTDTLYHTNLPNVRGEPGHYGSQRVCLRYRPEMLEGVPLAESVPALIDFFWSTGFNQDIANSAFGRAHGPGPALCQPRSLGGRQPGKSPFSAGSGLGTGGPGFAGLVAGMPEAAWRDG